LRYRSGSHLGRLAHAFAPVQNLKSRIQNGTCAAVLLIALGVLAGGCRGYGDFVENRTEAPHPLHKKLYPSPEIESASFRVIWDASVNAMKRKYSILLADDVNRHVRGLLEEPADKERVIRVHANIWISKQRDVYRASVEVAVDPPSRPEAPESWRREEGEDARYGGSVLFKRVDLYEQRRVAEERELRDALRAELAKIESEP